MKKLTSLLLALVMCFSLVACGGGSAPSGPDKQPAIDAFNAASTAFDTVAAEINANVDVIPQELVDVCVDMAGLLTEYKELLEGDQEIKQEDLDAMIEWFGTVESWTAEAKAEVEAYIAAANATYTKQDVIDYFNYVSPRFDAISTAVNENPEAFEQEFIDGMISIAEGMIAYRDTLSSDVELTEEETLDMLEQLQLVDEWVTALEEG